MVEYASGLTVFCQSSEIARLVEVLALIVGIPAALRTRFSLHKVYSPVRRSAEVKTNRRTGQVALHSAAIAERL